MQTLRARLENVSELIRQHPQAAVVVIDVIRAYSTAAYLYDAGVKQIILVGSIREALNWRFRDRRVLLAGEVGGKEIAGFDLGNAPSRIHTIQHLRGQRVIQRTSAGTQGAVIAAGTVPPPAVIYCTGLTNASATARAIQAGDYSAVILLETGVRPPDWGEEDRACADYLESLLNPNAREVDSDELIRRVRESRSGQLFDGSDPQFPPADLDLVTAIDRFDFVMRAKPTVSGLILEKIEPTTH